MKAPKILAVASAVDLDFRYGCTPAWWLLWKGMHEAGVDLIVTPYRGRAVESPWWRTAPNPLYREAETFARARDVVARLKAGDPPIYIGAAGDGVRVNTHVLEPGDAELIGQRLRAVLSGR